MLCAAQFKKCAKGGKATFDLEQVSSLWRCCRVGFLFFFISLRASLWLCNSLFSRNRKNDCLLLALLWARLLLLSRDISFFALTRFTCKREKMSRFFARRGDDSASSSDSDEEEATPMRGGISQK